MGYRCDANTVTLNIIGVMPTQLL